MISTKTRSLDLAGSMKAVVRDRYGSTDVLQLEEVARPVVNDGEVLVRVHAAGVDRGVWHVMAGRPAPIPNVGSGTRPPKQPPVGGDPAGRGGGGRANATQVPARGGRVGVAARALS